MAVIKLKVNDALEPGVVVHLNWEAGFGYVRNAAGTRQYIFVLGRAIRHAAAAKLLVGGAVRFRVSGKGRIDELVPVAAVRRS